MVVRELITKLGFRLDRNQLDNADKGVKRIGENANRTAVALRGMLLGLVSAASVKAIVNVADEMQSLRARIAQLPQTVGDAGIAFDTVAARAGNAKQSVDAYATFFIKAGNATQDFVKGQEELLKIVDGAAFGLAASGATAVAQGQAFFQLGQAIGSPVVQMEEMNTLIDAAPELFRELGKVIPGAEGNLKKFVSTGKVTGKMLAEGLVKVADVFEKKMKGIPLTVGTATVLVSNKFGLMIDRMNRKTFFITRIAEMFISAFDLIEAGVKKIEEVFGGWDNVMRLLGITIAVALGVKTLQILMAFRVASLAALAPWLLIAAGIAAVALAVEDLYVWVNGGDSIAGKLIGPWAEWRPYVIGAIELVTDALKSFFNILLAVNDIIGSAFRLDVDGFLRGLRELSSAIMSIVSTWGKAIYDSIFSGITNAVKNAFDSVKSIFSESDWGLKAATGTGASGASGSWGAPMVSPTQMAPSAMGAGRPSINNSTNVNVTVPKGTTDEQVKFLQSAAQQSFAKVGDNKLARDMATYAP